MSDYKDFRHNPDGLIFISDFEQSFSGTGLDNANFNGQYPISLNIKVQIDTVGSTDKFKYSLDGGVTWKATGVSITGYQQTLTPGVFVTFGTTNGHTLNDSWAFIGNVSMYPLDWFLTEEPAYALPLSPPNIISQWYIPGTFHKINTSNTEYSLSIPWVIGDGYIAKKTIYDAAYNAYINPIPTISEAKATKLGQLLDYFIGVREGGVIFGANTFPSQYAKYFRLLTEKEYADYLTDVPVGFYAKDVNEAHVSLTYTSLKDLVADIQKLYYECTLNYDAHYEAINALLTVGDVQSYDFTTGWPTVPFTP